MVQADSECCGSSLLVNADSLVLGLHLKAVLSRILKIVRDVGKKTEKGPGLLRDCFSCLGGSHIRCPAM